MTATDINREDIKKFLRNKFPVSFRNHLDNAKPSLGAEDEEMKAEALIY
jgi:hypothetical protein